MKLDRLKRVQLEKQLEDWVPITARPTPKKGWIHLIRTTLGLSMEQLAKRMGVNQARVNQIEAGERDKAITFKTLEKAATTMGCRLVYGIIPETTISDIIKQQASKVARQRLKRIGHSMELEEQGLSEEQRQYQYQELLKELLEGSTKKIWVADDEI